MPLRAGCLSRIGPCLLGLALLGLLLAGCTRIGVVYNRLDSLLHLQLARYVDLDKAQEADLDARFDRLWRWHRSTQLPLLAREVRGLRQAAAAPLSSAQIGASADRMRQQAQLSTVEALKAAAPLLVSLSDAQVVAFLAAIEKRAAKEQAKQQKLSDAEWAEKRADEAIDRLQEWAGSATPAQRQVIERWARASQRPSPAEQQARRKAFAALMQQRHAADFAARWQQFGLQYFSAEAQDRRAPQRQLTQRLLADLSGSATPQQRAYLQDKLAALATELDSLSQQGAKP